MPFTCSICGEESTRICARCTKDACNNHICEKCLRCSDCCECEVALAEPAHEPMRMVVRPAMRQDTPESALETAPLETATSHSAAPPDPEPQPEPHIPGPDPDPDPAPSPEEPGPPAA